MRIRVQILRDALRYSFLFLPSLLTLAGVLLALGTLALDARLPESSMPRSVLLYTGSADAARALLSTIASSVLSVAALAFSLAITALALAAGQFGSRLLRNFFDDGAFNWTLGTFCGTFSFCLLVLRALRSESEGAAFVPQISVLTAFVLAIVCVFLLIYFLNHVAASLQAPYVCADAANDLHREINRLFDVQSTQQKRVHGDLGEPGFDWERAAIIHSERDGYVKAINFPQLLELAKQSDCVLKCAVRAGDWVPTGAPLVWVSPPSKLATLRISRVKLSFVLGRARTPVQDPEYGINQLVEVACRALSPAINDPFTAMTCLDHLGSALCHVLRRELPSPQLVDEAGKLRVVAEAWTFAGMCDAAFHMIRQYGKHSPAVTIHLLATLAQIAPHCRTSEEKSAILKHAELTRADCLGAQLNASDFADLEERYALVKSRLN